LFILDKNYIIVKILIPEIMPNLKHSMILLFSLFVWNANAQCLKSWKYYKPIVVINNTSSALTNFQVKVSVNTGALISAGKMISTGDDIRILDSGSCQPIPYWIESGINTSNTIIWFKMPTLPANAHRTINMYYGNSSASAFSNGDSTFLIFDDFNGTAINALKWNTYATNNGKFSLSNGILTCSTNLEANLRSKASFSSPIIEESNVTNVTGSWASMAILVPGTMSGYTMFEGDVTAGTNTMYLSSAFKPSVPGTISYTGSTTNGVSKAPGSLNGVWQLYWSNSNIESATWPEGNLMLNSSAVTLSSNVQIAIGCMAGATGTMSIDWVRARMYAAKDATATPVVEEYNNGNSGIENIVYEHSFEIYPNPSFGQLYIHCNTNCSELSIVTITDLTGKTVQNSYIQGQNAEINIECLKKGIYFLRISSRQGSAVQKLIIK
jgi:hypothetical protein